MSSITADNPRYLRGVATLALDLDACTGCRTCTIVCPHEVFVIAEDGRARIADLDACMECGACALNCAPGAITVHAGVGCASAIVRSWILGGEPECGCSDDACEATPDAAPPSAGWRGR